MIPNPPAFPTGADDTEGMTLRDWFAAQALAGDLSSQSVETGEWQNTASDRFVLERARFYYRFADAMLAARNAA